MATTVHQVKFDLSVKYMWFKQIKQYGKCLCQHFDIYNFWSPFLMTPASKLQTSHDTVKGDENDG